jgi:ABC-type nickel/cobalt efflux system permease component RcnA
MDAMPLTVAGVGFVLGLRHALDPDHVVAVSALVSERAGVRRSTLVGALWGLGHALSLTLAGSVILVLKLSAPMVLARALESLVALMLVGLGAAAVRGALRYRLHAHAHAHGGREHVHVHSHRRDESPSHGHRHPLGSGLKPFLVGLVHGLAGSAGLALLALGTAPSLRTGLVYIALLGAGSVFGMVALSLLMGLPLAMLEARYAFVHRRVQLAAGASSVLLGLWLLGQHVLAIAVPVP